MQELRGIDQDSSGLGRAAFCGVCPTTSGSLATCLRHLAEAKKVDEALHSETDFEKVWGRLLSNKKGCFTSILRTMSTDGSVVSHGKRHCPD